MRQKKWQETRILSCTCSLIWYNERVLFIWTILFLSINCQGPDTIIKMPSKSCWRFIWWWIWFHAKCLFSEPSFRKYRQMSGVWLLVGLKDSGYYEKQNCKSKFCWRKLRSVVLEEWNSWNWKEILILLEFHWTHSCFCPIVEMLLYIWQAILQRNIWKKSWVAPVVKCMLRVP